MFVVGKIDGMEVVGKFKGEKIDTTYTGTHSKLMLTFPHSF